MKGNRLWRTPPKLSRADIWLTLLPALFWIAGIYSRGTLISPHCAVKPDLCTVQSLPAMDRPAVGLEAGSADGLSFTTQGLSGVLALSIPPLWHAGLLLTRQISPLGALIGVATDLVLFFQTTAWNGLFTEGAHLVAQRPRPFVYTDPQRARDFSNYTSFYSGHTSFSASSTVYLTATLASRGAPGWLIGAACILSYSLMSLTGLYRVLAGRHFPTDVLAGALAGTLIALAIAYRNRTQSSE